MSRDDTEIEWRHEYPWGRKHPEKRLAELEARRKDVLRRMRLLEDRFKERIIDFGRFIEAIDGEMEIARRCADDNLRRTAKATAHRLAASGIDVFPMLEEREIDKTLLDDFQNIEREARERRKKEADVIVETEADGAEDLEGGFISDDDVLAAMKVAKPQ